MVFRLDLGPLAAFQRRYFWATFSSGITIYTEGVAILALLTEEALHPAMVVPLILVIVAQYRVVRQPVRLLISNRLIRSYRTFLLLALAYVGLLTMGGRNPHPFAGAAVGAFFLLLMTWPIALGILAVRRVRPKLQGLANPETLVSFLTFSTRERLAVKLRSFRGDRLRGATPWLIAAVTLAVGGLAGGVVLNVLDVKLGHGRASNPLFRACLMGATWLFYRGLRQAQLRGSELQQQDPRPPVLLLREFADDALKMQRVSTGAPRMTLERVLTWELDRIGPATSIGRPGERLPPLGASRDYISHGDWKTPVAKLIERAGSLVFVLGESESLLWEFRTAAAAHCNQRTIVIVPPLRDRDELRHRWSTFVLATKGIIGQGVPAMLPDEPVLGFFLVGDDVVTIVGRKRNHHNYQLAIRLWGCLLSLCPTSAGDVEALLTQRMPIVSMSPAARIRARRTFVERSKLAS
jgi:hypothetical protein